jgi:phosphatidylglycerol---prolipoprotein diacylglyceryl transferase
MLTYPEIDPIAFAIGPLNVHWYGLMYLLGFAGAYALGLWRIKRQALNWTPEQLGDFIFFAALGVIIGGRVGYLVFYKTYALIHTPWVMFKLWEGGMSFHGGLLGVTLALLFFARTRKKTVWDVLDFAAPLIPFGLASGRLGNFINGELWGRTTSLPWGMVFPTAGPNPRHPTQLYEMALEGFALLFLLVWYSRKPRVPGTTTALFLMGYAVCRFAVEYWREPDPQLGYLAFGWLTMGQLLSIPMFIVGFSIWWMKRHEHILESHKTCP